MPHVYGLGLLMQPVLNWQFSNSKKSRLFMARGKNKNMVEINTFIVYY